MVTLVADDTTLLKEVARFIEPIEVYDSAGKLLGLFVPGNLERCKERYARGIAQIDWAEIKRRKESKEEGVPTREVLRRLEVLRQEMERRKVAGQVPFTTEEALSFFQSLCTGDATVNGLPEPAIKPRESGPCATP